jgi:RNA polymerase sigma factor for flagellar operon FliA
MRMIAETASVETCNRLVLEDVGLVRASRLARRIPAHVELSELVSVGMVGLVEAARRYRPVLGVPFDAFARQRVRGAMVDALRDLGWAPRSVRRMRREIDNAIARRRRETGREPTDHEIADALSVTETQYGRMLDQIRAVDAATLRQLDAGRDGEPLLEIALETDEGPHAQLERAELRTHLVRAINRLPERERQTLSLYYERELTLAEIGAVASHPGHRAAAIEPPRFSRTPIEGLRTMSRILTLEELKALVVSGIEPAESAANSPVLAYNFRRPDVTKARSAHSISCTTGSRAMRRHRSPPSCGRRRSCPSCRSSSLRIPRP